MCNYVPNKCLCCFPSNNLESLFLQRRKPTCDHYWRIKCWPSRKLLDIDCRQKEHVSMYFNLFLASGPMHTRCGLSVEQTGADQMAPPGSDWQPNRTRKSDKNRPDLIACFQTEVYRPPRKGPFMCVCVSVLERSTTNLVASVGWRSIPTGVHTSSQQHERPSPRMCARIALGPVLIKWADIG